jgi:hypothetical protein
MSSSKLVLTGNGFDLAHGLKTSYNNFINWYMVSAFKEFQKYEKYSDELIRMRKTNSFAIIEINQSPKTLEQVLAFFKNTQYMEIGYQSNFFQRLLKETQSRNWVDIELFYFRWLKAYFTNRNFTDDGKVELVKKLNTDFEFLIQRLAKYLSHINTKIERTSNLPVSSLSNILNSDNHVKFLNFNYTDTLANKYVKENDIIHIHGRVADLDNYPLIFGYGDETDNIYQDIEDSGENVYLRHIKSFGYFNTDSYSKLISFIDSNPFDACILGLSCGLSDRVLLNEIFEHTNCRSIEIFYHVNQSGYDNFTEITQEVSRHFKPNNKNQMRRRIKPKNSQNLIPQNGLKRI